jgi:AraC-like DNA-binding protein
LLKTESVWFGFRDILRNAASPGLGKNCYSSVMSIDALLLASGHGWRVQDLRCTSGPEDRPFEEQHSEMCIAVVTSGTFTYRTTQGSAVLAPGAALLGNCGHCFECGHEHGVGDRCLSFQVASELVESVLAEVPGVRRIDFACPSLPPIPELIPVVAAADAARHGNASVSFEELALEVVATVAGAFADVKSPGQARRRRAVGGRDEKRITAALRRIESESDRPLSLRELAAGAAMSRYHFLRTFRAVAGVTPHQFLLHTRLQRAAARLRCSNDRISAIAADAGFSDLSTFNRRFRRLLGASPGDYRSGRA